ncbi:glycosyltransferase [Photobacterium carnosum]|uniref:glycosyltransferase n=1 Tax=Photobacterium carnosum TaxID=2023717 RepID=UPI001E514295|nr:glycosyltransferase [Photobacterium carnosum]MCD9513347.1 glycosyltransferase [Photobacterium carnosum]
MKVSIVSHSDSKGGAARAAYRLHKALIKNDIRSEMLVRVKQSNDDTVISSSKFKQSLARAFNYISTKIQLLQKTKSSILHSSNLFGSHVNNLISNSDSDIINLHWINAETLSIKQIGLIDKPIVMTLHDMWAFCGTEHLSIDGDLSNFKVGYDKLNNNSDYISGVYLNKYIWNMKKKYWKNKFSIVTPSNWLSTCVKESVLFRGWDVYTIPNALDTDLFKPINKRKAREFFKLSNDDVLIGFGAMGGASDPNKGFDLLIQTLNKLPKDKKYKCLIFGQDKVSIDIELPVKFIGHVNDDNILINFYNAIDIMVVPSRQENLPQTGTEAMSCGTPVVAFNTTGLVDVVEHKVTGYLAEPFNTDDLANGIEWCCLNSKQQMSGFCRNRAVALWSQDVIAEQYSDLYHNIINNNKN